MRRQGTKGATVPVHDGRHKLSQDHGGSGREEIERRTERETHAKTADQDGWLRHRARPVTGECGHGFL